MDYGYGGVVWLVVYVQYIIFKPNGMKHAIMCLEMIVQPSGSTREEHWCWNRSGFSNSMVASSQISSSLSWQQAGTRGFTIVSWRVWQLLPGYNIKIQWRCVHKYQQDISSLPERMEYPFQGKISTEGPWVNKGEMDAGQQKVNTERHWRMC